MQFLFFGRFILSSVYFSIVALACENMANAPKRLPNDVTSHSSKPEASQPTAFNAALLQLCSQNESNWIMSQFLTILRHTVKTNTISRESEGGHFMQQGQQSCPDLDRLCSIENSSFSTADHDANIDLLFFIRSLGNNLTSMAEQRISRINQEMQADLPILRGHTDVVTASSMAKQGISPNKKIKQEVDADLPNLRGQTDVVTAISMAKQGISPNKKIKQEVDADLPNLRGQTDVVTTAVDVMPTSCFSNPEPETYHAFDDNKKGKQLIVFADSNYGYKYAFKARIGHVCINCSARARVISDRGETVVKSMAHDCVAIKVKAPLRLTKHANIGQSKLPLSIDKLPQNVIRRSSMKSRISQPFLNQYKFFYFGLSCYLRITMLYVKSNENANFYEYRHFTLNYFHCTYCKKLGKRVCIKLEDNSAFGQPHHLCCKGFPEKNHLAVQIKRRAMAKKNARMIRIEGESRFVLGF